MNLQERTTVALENIFKELQRQSNGTHYTNVNYLNCSIIQSLYYNMNTNNQRIIECQARKQSLPPVSDDISMSKEDIETLANSLFYSECIRGYMEANLNIMDEIIRLKSNFR
jgi:hypothetical protein